MEPGTSEYKIVFSAGIMTLIVLALLGNTLVCCAVYQSRHLRSRVNYLIVSLAVSDLLVATVSMPLWMDFELTGYRNMSPEATARLLRFSMFMEILGGIASIANLVAISFERLWSVISPLNHRRYLTNCTLFFIIMCVWLYAVLVAASTLALFETWHYVTLYNAVVGFFFPLSLIIGAYLTIYVIVNNSPRNVVSSSDSSKINLTICIIIALFVLCWTPHFVFSVLHVHCTSCYDHLLDNLWYRSLSTWLHYGNSCVNPVVYGIANAQYKEAFKTVLRKICRCCFFAKSEPLENTERLPSLYFPNGNHHERSNVSDKLHVELEPEEKDERNNHHQQGAAAFNFRTNNNTSRDKLGAVCLPPPPLEKREMYLQGDYRALPVQQHHQRNRRWTSDTVVTTDTYLASSLMESTIDEDENALINPDNTIGYSR